ncbi:ribonuclease H-like YkuK family protein [Paenibacillus sp. J2TS4]|uniref:ribonuclease H-like YkuK family protein n=1 Tax=Paenibacillus sp. J2TS4 TaxID=2807194 RepID=UPI001BCAB9CF|nr:ribonuclease H-like YkuK family protein [Paenibacillus sp. J2TS4]
MTINERFSKQEEMRFQNVTESRLSFDDVLQRILRFISQDPESLYHFVIGSDSQVYRGYTKFVTGIVIHRPGKGAWACYRQVIVPRELTSLKEKLSMETSLSQEVAAYFAGDAVHQMEELLLPHVYQGAELQSFIDIDAGTKPVINKTSLYVQEMVERVEAMGIYRARVKPDSYVASAYANRYTKKPSRKVM